MNEVGNDVQQVVRKQIIQASWGMCNGLGVRDSYWRFLKKPDRILVKSKPRHTCVFLQVVKGLKYFKYGQ